MSNRQRHEKDYIDQSYAKLNEPRIRSVNDWKVILQSEMKNNRNGFDFINNVLVEIYYAPNRTIFWKEFEKKTGIKGIKFRVGEFRDRIRKFSGVRLDEQIREDSGTDRAWNIPFYSDEKVNMLPENKGKFSWVLRDEIAKAMEELKIVESENSRINYLEDELLKEAVTQGKITTKQFYYTNILETRKEPKVSGQGISIYSRDRKKAINAIVCAQFKCEINPEHESFRRKSDGLPYMEAHHLIPMAYQDLFEFSLDVEENIVSLCSQCHNEIHYGEHADELIKALYYKRIDLLEKKKIGVSLEELLSYYGF